MKYWNKHNIYSYLYKELSNNFHEMKTFWKSQRKTVEDCYNSERETKLLGKQIRKFRCTNNFTRKVDIPTEFYNSILTYIFSNFHAQPGTGKTIMDFSKGLPNQKKVVISTKYFLCKPHTLTKLWNHLNKTIYFE